MDYTTTEIVSSLKARGLIPENSEKTFSADDLIRFMDEELRTVLVPKIMLVRENYFLEHEDIPVVIGQSRYSINKRAIGMKIKSLFPVDSNGRVGRKLTLTDVDEISSNGYWDTSSALSMYYFIDNFFEVLGTPRSNEVAYLRQYYFQRRNKLISSNDAGRIVDITGLNVEINSTPTAFTVNEAYDFVKGEPGFQNLDIDVTPSSVSGTVFTFSELPDGLEVGDWLCMAGTSPIPQVPLEIFPVIAQTAVAVALAAMKDKSGAEDAFKKRDEMMNQSMLLIGTRAEDNAKVLVSQTNIGNSVWGGARPWLR